MKNLSTFHFKERLTGAFLVVLAFFFAAVMNAIGKVVIQTVPIGIFLFVQNCIALLLLVPFIWRNPIHVLATKRLPLHFIRTFTGLLSYGCLFIAIKHISLVNATLLANSAPLFLPLIAIVWMKEHVPLTVWASLILGFIGVFFILDPSMGTMGNLMALVALMGSLFSAIALQTVRNLKTTESAITIVFYYFLIASIILLPFLFLQWMHPNPTAWILLIAMGILLGLTQLCLTQAYHYASPTFLGPFNYSVIVFAGFIQWAIWDVIPSKLGFIGIALVTLGGILTIIQQRKISKNT